MTKRHVPPTSLLSCTLLAGFALSGCGQTPDETNYIHVAVDGDASTLDPAGAYDTESIPYVRVLYRGLVDYDDHANIFNEVAAERKVSADGRKYWFKLRHDVRFHTGERVTAEDFRYEMERVLDPVTGSDGLEIYGPLIQGAEEFTKDRANPPDKRKLQHVSGIEVKGDDEITFTLTHPDVTFLDWLALPFAYAVPKDWTEKLKAEGKSLRDNPDGDGPFYLQEWTHDSRLILKKNPDYFHKDLPRSDGVLVEMGNSPYLQMLRFERGQIDILDISDLYPPDFLRLKASAKWQPYLQHGPLMDIRYVCLNTELPPFDNVLVRRAVNYAVDRQKIASFLTGRATLAHGALPPGMPGYNPNLKGYSYDPKKARELLNEAGYPNGIPTPITLWYSNGEAWYPKAAESIQADLAKVGITINLKLVQYTELRAAAGKRRNINMSIIGWLQDFPDPSDFLNVLLNGEAITPTASNNRAFYSNPKVNKLLDDAEIEPDRAKRLKMYQDAESIIVSDAPWIFLHHTERYVLHQPWISGYVLHPMWSQTYEYVGTQQHHDTA